MGPDERANRWGEVLDHLAGAIRPAARVVVDGGGDYAAVVADRLAITLQSAGLPCARLTDLNAYGDEDAWHAERTPDTVALADGPRWRARTPRGGWDVVIWLRTALEPGGGDADIVIDLHDPNWPVIRHVTARLNRRNTWYVSESRAFFAARAATWNTKFGDDMPAYAAAIAEAEIPKGAVVIDVGCGTGRALPALRAATGPYGTVIGLDLTPQMLDQARSLGHDGWATLIVADALHLPIGDARVDVVFAAGLMNHLPDPHAGLRELARVTRPGGRLVLFHPSGRAALAARHGRSLRPDEPLAEARLRGAAAEAGWVIERYDDPPHRFLAIAHRAGG